MNLAALTTRTGWSERTGRRYLAAWAATQKDPDVPRVRVVRGKGRGRPHYEVDRDSFDRWVLGLTAAAA